MGKHGSVAPEKWHDAGTDEVFGDSTEIPRIQSEGSPRESVQNFRRRSI
ncbi:hypothetical protein LFML04_2126 [Leptospirillum ferriphilum ML-04]|uniref:Uncharacterized protein n=1 Tax=Leptospirillum ferriphilum (strain ML-04) TaxID=1048260 RepID=J9ZDY7_LEPFM|nr:hypothetical protein LFML04_2126 [Leptospirillum ferriphilum ML-04]